VPIQPRVTTRPSPRFASEPEAEPVSSPVVEAKEKKAASNGHGAPPELVPVKASVFDDDFFRASSLRGEPEEGVLPERFREPAHSPTHLSTH